MHRFKQRLLNAQAKDGGNVNLGSSDPRDASGEMKSSGEDIRSASPPSQGQERDSPSIKSEPFEEISVLANLSQVRNLPDEKNHSLAHSSSGSNHYTSANDSETKGSRDELKLKYKIAFNEIQDYLKSRYAEKKENGAAKRQRELSEDEEEFGDDDDLPKPKTKRMRLSTDGDHAVRGRKRSEDKRKKKLASDVVEGGDDMKDEDFNDDLDADEDKMDVEIEEGKPKKSVHKQPKVQKKQPVPVPLPPAKKAAEEFAKPHSKSLRRAAAKVVKKPPKPKRRKSKERDDDDDDEESSEPEEWNQIENKSEEEENLNLDVNHTKNKVSSSAQTSARFVDRPAINLRDPSPRINVKAEEVALDLSMKKKKKADLEPLNILTNSQDFIDPLSITPVRKYKLSTRDRELDESGSIDVDGSFEPLEYTPMATPNLTPLMTPTYAPSSPFKPRTAQKKKDPPSFSGTSSGEFQKKESAKEQKKEAGKKNSKGDDSGDEDDAENIEV